MVRRRYCRVLTGAPLVSWVFVLGCDSGAVGVETCRDIEYARCDAAVNCPNTFGVKSAKELNGATVCVLPGTTTELNLADYFRANGMTMTPVVIEQNTELSKAFFAGR